MKYFLSLITDAGYNPTEIKDRKYFKAIYFRDRGGILFELSTLKPGMTIDEDVDALGSELLIPKHYEEHKDIIEDRMMPVFVRPVDHLESYSYRNRKEFEVIQELLPKTFYLVPGYGAQGGKGEDIGRILKKSRCAVINSSRGLITAHKGINEGENCWDEIRRATLRMKEDLEAWL